MNYLLKIVESGSGREFTVGTYSSLKECSTALEQMDDTWVRTPLPILELLPDHDPMAHYEGCDAYATDEDGVTWEESFGEWERW